MFFIFVYVRRGPGGPRYSRPGGRRYLFLQRPATLSQTGEPLYAGRQNRLKRLQIEDGFEDGVGLGEDGVFQDGLVGDEGVESADAADGGVEGVE